VDGRRRGRGADGRRGGRPPRGPAGGPARRRPARRGRHRRHRRRAARGAAVRRPRAHRRGGGALGEPDHHPADDDAPRPPRPPSPRRRRRGPTAWTSSWACAPPGGDPGTQLASDFGCASPTELVPEPPEPPSGFCDPLLQDVLESTAAGGQPGDAARLAAAEQLLWRQLPVLPLFQPVSLVVSTPAADAATGWARVRSPRGRWPTPPAGASRSARTTAPAPTRPCDDPAADAVISGAVPPRARRRGHAPGVDQTAQRACTTSQDRLRDPP
jgi:hypothetical protein